MDEASCELNLHDSLKTKSENQLLEFGRKKKKKKEWPNVAILDKSYVDLNALCYERRVQTYSLPSDLVHLEAQGHPLYLDPPEETEATFS